MLSPEFETARQLLKQLPALGYYSSEKILAYLLAERPEKFQPLMEALHQAAKSLRICPKTGNLTSEEFCAIYTNCDRERTLVCLVESVSDVLAMERTAAFQGVYHVLGGRLSPLQGIGPQQLRLDSLWKRIEAGEIEELILALPNDVEGEATCHYLAQQLEGKDKPSLSRIGFGLPSGSSLIYADGATLSSALAGRRAF